MKDMFDRLADPFDVEAVSWRVGSTTADKSKGMALAYLDARDVMDRLDIVCGPGGWQCRYSHANGKTVCDIGIKVDGEWVWKADGAGDTDYEAEKGALSDAFKRAAVRWGIGRYLYGLNTPWVKIQPAGPKSFKIDPDEFSKLRKCLRDYAGIDAKSAAQAKRDQDYEFYKAKIEAAETLSELEAVSREIKANMHMLPAAVRDPLRNDYALRKEELQSEARAKEGEAELDDAFSGAIGGRSAAGMAGRNGHMEAAE